MPYILQEDRTGKEIAIQHLAEEIKTVGDLNYTITRLVHGWMARETSSGGDKYAARYATHNSAIGVLECAKQELYRRLTAPYEDLVIAKNGDV
jgi:hypothetical protein